MVLRVRVTHNLDSLIRRIDNLERDLLKGRTLWFGIQRRLRLYQAQVFQSETWNAYTWPFYFETFSSARDALQYIEWKERKHPGTGYKLLRLSGRLERSLTGKTSDSINTPMTDRFFTFGTKVRNSKGRPYASFHNDADGINGWRPFLREDDPNIDKIADDEAHLFGGRVVRRYFK